MQDIPSLSPGSPESPGVSGAQGDASPKIVSPRMVPVGGEIKRSSWYAGMATDPAMPPPGSPAAWQGRKGSRSSSFRPVMNPLHSPGHQLGGPADQSGEFEIPRDGSARDSSALFIDKRRLSSGRSSLLAVPSLRGTGVETPSRSLSPIRSVSGSADGPDQEYNPFNFQPTYVTPASRPSSAGRASQRRGHRYKHSSVSINFFQEPEERAPLAIPASLAVPTFREYWQSVTHGQSMSLLWCCTRMIIAVLVYSMSSPTVHSVSTVAHLLAYETAVSTTIASVEILANFDVWKQSSLRLPFALKRVEVLVAFGLAAVLMFVGGDVFSHIIQELAAGGSHGHADHHADHHGHDGVYESAVSGKQTKQHIAVVSLAMLSMLPSVIRAGPTSALAGTTLSIAAFVLIVPILPSPYGYWIDALLMPITGLTMIWLGWRSAKLFGGMLVMSYGGPDRSKVIANAVSADPNVADVTDISLWQVHHDLWLASMRIVMSGKLADERRVRELAATAVRTAMGADISEEVEWETTIDITRAEVDS